MTTLETQKMYYWLLQSILRNTYITHPLEWKLDQSLNDDHKNVNNLYITRTRVLNLLPGLKDDISWGNSIKIPSCFFVNRILHKTNPFSHVELWMGQKTQEIQD